MVFNKRTLRYNSNSSTQPLSLSDISGSTSLGASSSFRYDPIGYGLKSTQQLNVDWSKFSSHTFFNSAEVKTNQAFQKIYDRFPFDGTGDELETFQDNLTGFEKYVYDSLPKHTGYLFLSGTNGSEAVGGTYVSVVDSAGGAYQTLSRNPTGISELNPGLKSLSVELHLCLPGVSNSNQIIAQKLSGSHGFTMYLGSTGSISSAPVWFEVSSGSSVITAGPMLIQKGSFNHLAFVWDRSPVSEQVFGYKDGELVCTSSQANLGVLGFDSANFMVGSGSATTNGFVPQNTLSGAIDEFRVWHTARQSNDINKFMYKSVSATEGLKLYFKFNEPDTTRTVVIDSSGNGLFGDVSTAGMLLGVRSGNYNTSFGSNPILYEIAENNPVLFPEYSTSEAFRQVLLLSASNYDSDNPSLITKLVPPHYFRVGQDAMGFKEAPEGSILDTINYSTSRPGQASLGETQAILLVLFTWAKFFDELRLITGAFENLIHVDYPYDDFEVAPNTIPDQLIWFLAKRYGVELPPLFIGSTIPQFIHGENLTGEGGISEQGLRFIQNQIWRRILINVKDIIKSKGTIHSIKTFIRSTGIEPNNIFRIREKGNKATKTIKDSTEQQSETSTMLDFADGGVIQSEYLVSPRVEPGWPTPSGNSANDALLTSGSFTFEGLYKLTATSTEASQSLARLCSTGSNGTILLANLVALSGSGLVLYVGPTSSTNVMSMSLSGFDLWEDEQLWHCSFGRVRGDEIESSVSSSYFLRAARASNGNIVQFYSSSIFFNDSNSVFQSVGTENPSGSFLVIGSGSIPSSGSYLNSLSMPTTFQGKAGHFKFWSKAVSQTEWLEHAKNFASIGTVDPSTNFNFVTSESGSYEKLRMDVTTDQLVTQSNLSGEIQLVDFTQNGLGMNGSGFTVTSSIIVPERMFFSFPSPHFDELTSENKVRIRSLLNPNENDILTGTVEVAPVYESDPNEEPSDSNGFSIDIEANQALNRDIMQIFAGLDKFDSILGKPTAMFGSSYKEFDFLREEYFKRLTKTINLKLFFEFYKWFDTNLGKFIQDLIPSHTNYDGINYIISPHVLERSRMEYRFAEAYLGQTNRQRKSTLLLQFFAGKIGRF